MLTRTRGSPTLRPVEHCEPHALIKAEISGEPCRSTPPARLDTEPAVHERRAFNSVRPPLSAASVAGRPHSPSPRANTARSARSSAGGTALRPTGSVSARSTSDNSGNWSIGPRPLPKSSRGDSLLVTCPEFGERPVRPFQVCYAEGRPRISYDQRRYCVH